MPSCTIETRLKQSNTRKRLYAEGKLQPSFKHLPTYVYDLDGNFIKEYPSMKDAAIGEFGKNTGAVRSACYGIENPFHRVHNRLFYIQKLDKAPSYNSSRHIWIVESDKEYYEFKEVKDIANFFSTKTEIIAQYIRKHLKYKRKYMIYKRMPCN